MNEHHILFIDNHLLVIKKDAGILAQGDETGDLDLINLGKAYLKQRFNKPGKVYLGLVHRLDRPVSGLMVMARTSKAAARLTQQFKQHTVVKRYMALVQGRLEGNGIWVDHLLKDGRQARVVPASHPKGKLAKLAYEAVCYEAGYTLVDIQLFTGRAHQIRLQFSSRGHALKGDLRYGASDSFDGRNLALHAYHLAVEHPTKKQVMSWTLAPPDTWTSHHDGIVELLSRCGEKTN